MKFIRWNLTSCHGLYQDIPIDTSMYRLGGIKHWTGLCCLPTERREKRVRLAESGLAEEVNAMVYASSHYTIRYMAWAECNIPTCDLR